MANNDYIVFGNENAEDDDLLYSCKIEKNSPNDRKPILIGRWGTGKSALLLLQNLKLSETLKNLNPSLEKSWYLREDSIDFGTLSQLKQKHENDPDIFIKSLEELWKIEILRVYVIVLNCLKPLCRNTYGEHWDFVVKLAEKKENYKPYWKQLPLLVNFFTKQNISETIDRIGEIQKEFTNDKLYETIQKCLLDINYETEIYPVIAIEPIETPTSALEKTKGLAQMLITALLNSYYKNFQFSPNNNKKFKLRISIPWHRYVIGDIDFTQKFFQFEGQVTWVKPQLKEFINKRIEFEFKRVGRRISFSKDIPDFWSMLFEPKIVNGFCEPAVFEDSFDYFIRHTHYRARDLLRLTRVCVEEYSNNNNLSLDETLKIQIPIASIKETFRKIGSKQAEYLITEGSRRFPGLEIIVQNIVGLPLLFTKEDLKKRIDKNIIDASFTTILDNLWESGIIGITVDTNGNNKDSKWLESQFTMSSKRVYENKERSIIERWTWFEYNYLGQPLKLLDKLESLESSIVNLTYHPKTFEYFSPRVKDLNSPIGI